MKVWFKKEISAMSGADKDMDIVFASHRNGGVCIARDYTAPVATAQNEQFKTNSANIKSIWNSVSVDYKTDMKKYCHQLGLALPNTQMVPGVYSLFIRILYQYAKATTTEIGDLDYASLKTSAVKDVAGAVSAGYLKAVDGAADLTHIM